MQTPLRIIRDASLGPFLIFYLLLNIHSYRILDAQKKLDLAFFLPKLLLVLPYAIFRVFAFFYARAVLSEMAFISAIVVQHAFGAYHLWRTDREQVIMIAITTSYEFFATRLHSFRNHKNDGCSSSCALFASSLETHR
eukprot:IDg17159t1